MQTATINRRTRTSLIGRKVNGSPAKQSKPHPDKAKANGTAKDGNGKPTAPVVEPTPEPVKETWTRIEEIVARSKNSGKVFRIPAAFISHTGGAIPFKGTNENARDYITLFPGKGNLEQKRTAYKALLQTYHHLACMAASEERNGAVQRYTVHKKQNDKWSVSSRKEFANIGSVQAQLNNAAVQARMDHLGKTKKFDVRAVGSDKCKATV